MCAVRAAVSGCARANLSTGERFPELSRGAREFEHIEIIARVYEIVSRVE